MWRQQGPIKMAKKARGELFNLLYNMLEEVEHELKQLEGQPHSMSYLNGKKYAIENVIEALHK